MRRISVDLIRGVSKFALSTATRVDGVVMALRDVEPFQRQRQTNPVSNENGTPEVSPQKAPPRRSTRAAWDLRTIPPPSTPSVPPPALPTSASPRPAYARTPTLSDFPAPVQMLKNVLTLPRLNYRGARPWMQPSPIDQEGLAQTVLGVPEAEVREFMTAVVPRYVRTVQRYWVNAAAYALKYPGLTEVTDQDFARLLGETPFNRFLCTTLDPVDQVDFAGLFDPTLLDTGRYAKLDFMSMARVASRPGLHSAPTVTLLEQRSGVWTPLAIRINGLTVEPKHRNAYELAKYFVLQGAASSFILGLHPNVHFPMDAINAVTRSILPEEHPVRLLLEQHFYTQLPLNYSVLYIDKSVVRNDQREIYTPFVGDWSSHLEMMADYHRGVPGNSARPGYRYGLDAPDVPSGPGKFLKSYFDAVLTLTTQVLRSVAKGDDDVRRWSQHLSGVVRGFPNSDEIFHGDTLARAVAFFIWDVSVLHSSDHYAYSQESINQVPLRMRVGPPKTLEMPAIDRTRLVTKEDLFRHRMARAMYFKPSVLRHLSDVEYELSEPQDQRAVRDFKERLRTIDADPKMRAYCPLDQIASSIQF